MYQDVQHDVHVEERADERTVTTGRRWWTPAQLFAGIIGLGFLVMGAVALIRIGFEDLTETASVGWYTRTGILALIEVVLGLILIAIAFSALESRSSLIVLGVLMVAFGLIAVIEPEGTAEYLGDSEAVGWTYFAIGVTAAIIGWVSPLVSRSSTHTEVTRHTAV